MRKKYIWTILLLMTLLITACGQKAEEPSGKEAAKEQAADKFTGEWIVDAEYAVSRIGQEDTLFVDARGEGKAVLGTVEGAIATAWGDWIIQEGEAGDENWGRLQEPEEISKTLSNLGISKDKEIIFIAETINGWGDDARLLWQLRAIGYTDIKFVDGGYDAMKAQGAPTQFLASKPEAAEVKIDEIDYSHVITTEQLQENYDNYKIVDVRTDEEYNGAVLYGEAKGGHLPGAIHIRYTDLFKEDGTLKSNAELTKMFEDAGLTKEDEIVTYCTSGIRSAYAQLVMEMCGFEKTYNYEQSFARWAAVGEVE